MENKELPEGCYRIIIADMKAEKIIVDEQAVCVVGGFSKVDDLTSGLCSAHCIAFSKYKTGVAIKTAEAAEEAAEKMRRGALRTERNALWEKIKKLFKKSEEQ